MLFSRQPHEKGIMPILQSKKHAEESDACTSTLLATFISLVSSHVTDSPDGLYPYYHSPFTDKDIEKSRA